jgi:hypothetical protein
LDWEQLLGSGALEPEDPAAVLLVAALLHAASNRVRADAAAAANLR